MPISGGRAVDATGHCRSWRNRRPEQRWLPKLRDASAFPWPAEIRDLAEDRGVDLFPIPLLPRPTACVSRSHRLRARRKIQDDAWREANRYLVALNALRRGGTSKQTKCRARPVLYKEASPAQARAQQVALREATRVAMVRSGSRRSAQPVSKLSSASRSSTYSLHLVRSSKHVSLIVDAIDEPTTETVVPMLDALPLEEAEFYASETNVVETDGKLAMIFQ